MDNRGNITISVSKKFMAGVLVCSALRSLQEDYWGMEGTIRHLVNDWVSWKITVPLAVGMLIASALLCADWEKAD
jgi:purine-cytosine permease-like protein